MLEVGVAAVEEAAAGGRATAAAWRRLSEFRVVIWDFWNKVSRDLNINVNFLTNNVFFFSKIMSKRNQRGIRVILIQKSLKF